ncbi:MAG TPA: AraC family transcriptional regulator [Polyangiaceae bacterium]|nr:AraC family transcriptional regulator [Polyangiaceae bacterium]
MPSRKSGIGSRRKLAASPATPPSLPALLTPIAAHAFNELQVSVSFQSARGTWESITRIPSVVEFEIEYGADVKRWPYNGRLFAEARRTGRMACGEHAGFHDLFFPVQGTHGDSVGFHGVLVAGPLAKRRPSSAEVLERWYSLSATHGRLSDPSFFQYLSETLTTLTLEGPHWNQFERLMSLFSLLITGRGSVDTLAQEIAVLREKLADVRFEERMWSIARGMLSDRKARSWGAPAQARDLHLLGLGRVPENVVVGLVMGEGEEPDAVDAFLRRYEFQRACAALAKNVGGVVCGQVGDRGITFLTDDTGGASRIRTRLADLATRAATLARRFGYRLHAGLTARDQEVTLSGRYLMALAAAEMALSRKTSLVYGNPRQEHSAKNLRKLRRQLAASFSESPISLSPRFEHYAQTVIEHSGYQLEPVRAKLEAGFERLTEPLLATGVLDEKSFDELWSSMEKPASESTTLTELVARYGRLVSDIENAILRPTEARRTRGIQRALSFMGEHLGEKLTLPLVARAAGFAPAHFSRIVKQSEGVTFERALRKLRLERAREMLLGTALHVEAVSTACGFHNRVYFHRLFKDAFGVTPIEYRERAKRYED